MKSKMSSFPLIATAAALFVAGTAPLSAVGNRTLDHLEMMFTKADKNTDGEVTKEEIKAANHRMSDKKTDGFFAANDKNGNGTLNKDEFTANALERTQDKQPAAKIAKPNIIFIIADDLGYSDIGCYGGEIATPNLDRLAREGLRFRQFYNNAKCETTRSALMSGRYHVLSGLHVQNGTTLGAVAKSGGYQTYAVGKWHLGSDKGQTPVERGFDHFYGFYGGGTPYFNPSPNSIRRDSATAGNFVSADPDAKFSQDSATRSRQTTFAPDYYATDSLGDNAAAFVTDAVTKHADRPFFMYLAFNAPHAPAEAPAALVEKYKPLYARGWDQLRAEKWARLQASGLVDPQWQLPDFPTDVPRWESLTQKEKEFEILRRANYGGQVDSLDQNIGKLLALLDKLEATHPGLVKNTLIMFISDNGCAGHDAAATRNQGPGWATLSNTPFRYFKQSQQQGGISTPMVARWPQVIAPGTITDQPGHVIDIMATLNDVGQADYHAQKTFSSAPVPPMSGTSLLPIFKGGTRPPPSWVFELHQNEFAVIQGDWKLASFRSSPWRLFNLREDRTETRNLRFENPEKAKELAAVFDQWAPEKLRWAHRDPIGKVVGYEPDFRYGNSVHKLYREPSIGLTLTNLGKVSKATVSDEAEYCLIHTASAGFGDGTDNGTYLNKPFRGDGQVTAQLETSTGTTTASRSGVMIRESLDPGSPFIMTAIAPDRTVTQIVRAVKNGPVTITTAPEKAKLPVFLRVQRQGDRFTASYSVNEYYWKDFATTTQAMSTDAFGGVAAASGSADTRAYFQWREWENRADNPFPQASPAIGKAASL